MYIHTIKPVVLWHTRAIEWQSATYFRHDYWPGLCVPKRQTIKAPSTTQNWLLTLQKLLEKIIFQNPMTDCSNEFKTPYQPPRTDGVSPMALA